MASKKKSEQPKLEKFFGKRKRDQETACLDGIVHTADSRTQTVEAKPARAEGPEVSPPEPQSSISPGGNEDQLPSTSTSASASMKAKVDVKVKQARGFDPKWKQNRPWLEFVPGSGMFCTYCKKFNKTPFGREVWSRQGCVRLRYDSVKAHENCIEHRDSVSLHLQRETRHIDELLTNPKEISQENIVKAFQCLYFLARSNIPHTTNFEKLLDLLTQLGLDIKSKICKGANAKYTSETAIKEFLLCLGEVIEQKILSEFRENRYYALMFDETTDVSTTEQMVIHGRYVNSDGEIVTRFLKIVDCLEPDGDDEVHLTLNADKISQKVTNYLEENQLPFDGLVGLGTDGAAVMVGKCNGAVKKIVDIQTEKQTDKENKVRAVGQHCAAHKLNLAASKTGNSFPPIERFKKTLSKLHDFYSRSAVRSKGLETVQKLLFDSLDGESEGEVGSGTGKVLNPSSTRWLALGKCALGLKRILTSVLISLERESEERGDVVATGLYHLMSKTEFLAVLLLLCDILPTVNRLSCLFQTEAIDFPQVAIAKQATLKALESKKEKSSNDANFQAMVSNLHKNGIKLDYADKEATSAILEKFDAQVRRPYITKLQENISDRFQDDDVMASFAKFGDRKFYAPEKAEELQASIAVLTEQFGLDSATVQAEVADIRHYVDSLGSSAELESAAGGMVEMFLCQRTLVSMFPNLSVLAKIYKTIPPHTADCERDFSRMKMVKTDHRNRMGEDTLECLMRITISGPDPEKYPFLDAVKLWATKKERRYRVKLV